MFYRKNDASDHFRVDRSDVTLTKSAACAQKRAAVNADLRDVRNTRSQDTPPEPLQQKLFGEYIQEASPTPTTVPFTHDVFVFMDIWIPCFFAFLGPESIQNCRKSIKKL